MAPSLSEILVCQGIASSSAPPSEQDSLQTRHAPEKSIDPESRSPSLQCSLIRKAGIYCALFKHKPSARIKMEASQIHHQQKEHENPPVEPEAKPLSRSTKEKKPLVALFMRKIDKKWDVILRGILVFLSLVLLSVVIFLAVSKARECLPSSPAPPAPTLCPILWVGYGERCYYLSAVEANWTHSQSHCASQGGSLVTMESPEEKDFVQRYKDHIGYWIGVRRESLSRPWMRTDESLFNNPFPIRGEGLCAYVTGRGFSSTWCANTRYWICSKQAH